VIRSELIQDLEKEAATARAEADELRRDLQDPVLVHANMLRGTIAKLSMAQQLHLVGADKYNALADELARRVGVAASQDLLRMIGADPFVPDSEINEVIARVRAEMEKEKGNG